MWYLLEFLAKKYHYLLFLLLEIIGVVLLFRGNSYQGSVWLSSANTAAGKCYDMTSAVSSYFNLRDINRQLTTRNTLLEHQLQATNQQLEKLSPDTFAMKALLPQGYHTIDARVVQNSITKKDNLLTIDKGSEDGVKKNMGVVSGTGVVGIVYLVGKHYSVVIPILNSHSNISCSIRDRGYFGYLNWDGGDARYAYMDDVPRYAHYKNGEIVQTSGYSAVFPPGLTVGKILHTYNSADGLSYRIKLELATDFARLHDVCVVDNSKSQEQLNILRQAQDSLQNRQN